MPMETLPHSLSSTSASLPHHSAIRRHPLSSSSSSSSSYSSSSSTTRNWFHYLLLPQATGFHPAFHCTRRSGSSHGPLPQRSTSHDFHILCQGLKGHNSGHTPSGEEGNEEEQGKEEASKQQVEEEHGKKAGDRGAAAMADEKGAGLQGRRRSRVSINESDWRAFRARLVAGEQAPVASSDLSQMPSGASVPTISLGKCWAHPLHAPEAGCLLIATDKLDGQIDFERTVILLLRSGSNKPREGPFGVILNRPTSQTIKELDHENRTLAGVFGDCEYFYGGPLESELLLLLQEQGKASTSKKQFEEIIPGISHIPADKLPNAARLMKGGAVKTGDFRYFIGYSGWGLDQLLDEIEAGYWYVASCSSAVLQVTPADKLWQKVLWLMGGHYAELSRKPLDSGPL